jgi:hypothetical protein
MGRGYISDIAVEVHPNLDLIAANSELFKNPSIAA